jgi:hypothetical protein
MLNTELGLQLRLAERVADRVLAGELAPNRIRISATSDRSMALQLDLPRFLSTSNAALAAAFAFVETRRRGRPKRAPRQAAVIDEFSVSWVIRVDNEREKLVRLADQLRQWSAYPRGIQPGLPFIMDAVTIRAIPRLALTTTRGEIDVLLNGAGAPAPT